MGEPTGGRATAPGPTHHFAMRAIDPDYVADFQRQPVTVDEQGLMIGGRYVMFHAERALMRQHAEGLLEGHRDADVLEIGFGLGVFAQEVNALGPGSYTCVELHPAVAALARHLLRPYAHPCTVRVGPWQHGIPAGARYDAVMMDSFPPDGAEREEFEVFVRCCLPRVLRDEGSFSFFQCGPLAPAHDALLRRAFTRVTLHSHVLDPVPPGWTLESNRMPVYVCRGPVAGSGRG